MFVFSLGDLFSKGNYIMWARCFDKIYCPACKNYLIMTTPSFKMCYVNITLNEQEKLRGTLECESQVWHGCERIG